MSNRPPGQQNDAGATDANQEERALPAAPPSSVSPVASTGSIECVDGRRVLEFDVSGTATQLLQVLAPFSEREEKVHLKVTNNEKLTHCECVADPDADEVLSCVGSVDLSSLNLEKVPSHFLSHFTDLKLVDLAPLGNVSEVGAAFLYATGLTQLDLSPLRNVQSVAKSFLSSMESLKTIDLSPLSKLTCIPDSVLYWCKNLTSLNMQGLNQVRKIGDYFCCNCSSLRHLDLSAMKSVTELGDKFCSICDQLESIDLSGFSNVRQIGDDFLKGCPRLKHADCSAMQNLEVVGSGFLYQQVHTQNEIDGDDCANSSLKSINLSGLRKLKKIDGSFLSGCCNLTHVDLSAMQALEEVGEDFLLDCPSLQSINMKGLNKLATVGDCFLCNASSLEHLDLSAMQNLEHVGYWFLSDCTSLKSTNMKGLNKLSTVGNCFLWNASSLAHLDLSGCVSLAIIGRNFCCNSSSLQSVNFTNVERVREIKYPDTFFEKCPKLSRVIGLPDCIRDKLPKEHPVRKHGQRYWRIFALLIREKSRGHAYDAFRIWNVMRFVAEYL